MKLNTIIEQLEMLAPLSYAEDFDNVGLLTGNSEQEINGILVCHDVLENVINEAIEKKCNPYCMLPSNYFFGFEKNYRKNLC
jgi:putative NIF3 family GTP cyclohydrolase 1 type 2